MISSAARSHLSVTAARGVIADRQALRVPLGQSRLLEGVECGVETSQFVLCGLEHGLCAGAAVAVFPCGWTRVLDHETRLAHEDSVALVPVAVAGPASGSDF